MKKPMVTSTVEKSSRAYDRNEFIKRGNLVEGVHTGTIYMVVGDSGSTRNNPTVIHPGPGSIQISIGDTYTDIDSMGLKPYTGKIGLEMIW